MGSVLPEEMRVGMTVPVAPKCTLMHAIAAGQMRSFLRAISGLPRARGN
jgi:hypothetical protein